ncbi:MAG: TrfB-related DNA-binding protein, partial [Methylobacter sp.]
MKLADFIKTADSTRMAQRTKDAARLVLVDGIRAVDAARQMGMKRQQVEEAVARIEAAYKAAQGIPEGWECVTVCVPPERAC